MWCQKDVPEPEEDTLNALTLLGACAVAILLRWPSPVAAMADLALYPAHAAGGIVLAGVLLQVAHSAH